MITLALTGSIGMGKSTVAAMFAEAGVPTFDADAVVRQLQGPGGRLVPLIEARFPNTTRNGAVDRDALSLPPRQLSWALARMCDQSHRLEQIFDSSAPLVRRNTGEHQRVFDVFECR